MNSLIRLTETTAQQTGSTAQGVGDMLTLLMIVMLGGATAYCLYTWFRLRKECTLFPNKFMYPGNCKPEDCLDKEGFMDYIQPKLLIFGLLLLACTGGFVAVYFLHFAGIAVDLASILLPLAIFGWYIFVQNRAAKEFWGA